jgi:hypothetical protein
VQHLEFDITDDDQFLQINGQPVFPPPQTLIPISLKAPQIRTSDKSHTTPLRLGYALEVLPSLQEVTDIALTPIQFTVLDLQGVPVKVDTVKIDLIQSWGKLHIARISNIPYKDTPGADRCENSLCRLRAIITNRLRKMIEMAKEHAGKAKTWFKNTCGGRKHRPVEGAQKEHKKVHHHGHHRHHRVKHILKQFTRFFVIPAVLGVLGGILACAIGMLVGQVLVALWSRFRRGGERASVMNGETALADDEKDALVGDEGMPPHYEDVDVVVVEQK